LTGIELALANSWLVPTADADLWRSPSVAGAQIQRAASDSGQLRTLRPAIGSRPRGFAEQRSPDRMAQIVRSERDTLFPKYNLLNGISLVDAYGGVDAADYQMLLGVAEGHGPMLGENIFVPHPDALRLLGAEWLIVPPESLPDFAAHVTDQVWRVPSPLPRSWIVEHLEVVPPRGNRVTRSELEDRARRVLFPDLKPRDFRAVAVVETRAPPQEVVSPERAALGDEQRCEITHSSPQRVVIDAVLRRPGLVVLTDRYDNGWTAHVATGGGETTEAPILRTNLVFRGVYLPAGKNTVEFRYRPISYVRGAWISGVSWALLALGCLAALLRRRKSAPQMQ
jgi:hypothetical protein